MEHCPTQSAQPSLFLPVAFLPTGASVSNVVHLDGDVEFRMSHIDVSDGCPVLDEPTGTECSSQMLRTNGRTQIGPHDCRSFPSVWVVAPSLAQGLGHATAIGRVLPAEFEFERDLLT